jgi:SAM-dependent methyltransferase
MTAGPEEHQDGHRGPDEGRDQHRGHPEEHEHGHGHVKDQGWAGAKRYLKQIDRLWSSEINELVVGEVAPVPGERVVDIGAGMGAGAIVAARTGAVVVAVEPTPFLRRVLRLRRLFSRSRSRIVVAEGAAEKLPVADRTADAIWAVNTMHHWIDPVAAVTEVVRILRPGGRVLLVDEDFQDPAHPEAARFAEGNHGPQRHGFAAVDAEAMGARLAQAGLADVEAGRRVIGGRPVLAVSGRATF